MRLVILVFIQLPFVLAAQNKDLGFAACPVKMNVLYAGITNPVEIVAEGYSDKRTSVTIDNGSIAKVSPYQYNIIPSVPGKLKVNVTVKKGWKTIHAGTHEFRVKSLPLPTPRISGLKGGPISKVLLKSQTGIIAELENFDIDIRYEVCSFTCIPVSDGTGREIRVNGSRFTSEVIAEINKLKEGDVVYFADIIVKMADGKKVNLGYIKLVIN